MKSGLYFSVLRDAALSVFELASEGDEFSAFEVVLLEDVSFIFDVDFEEDGL